MVAPPGFRVVELCGYICTPQASSSFNVSVNWSSDSAFCGLLRFLAWAKRARPKCYLFSCYTPEKVPLHFQVIKQPENRCPIWHALVSIIRLCARYGVRVNRDLLAYTRIRLFVWGLGSIRVVVMLVVSVNVGTFGKASAPTSEPHVARTREYYSLVRAIWGLSQQGPSISIACSSFFLSFFFFFPHSLRSPISGW